MEKKLLFIFVSIISLPALLAQTWTAVSPAEISTATGITVHNNALFISTQAASPHRSADGSTWEKKDNGITTPAGPQGGGVGSAGSWLYYGSKDSIYRSNDDGATWSGAGNGITVSAFNYARYFYEFNGVYFCVMSGAVVSGGGLFRSVDGVNWESSTLGSSSGEAAYEMVEIDGKLYVGSNMSFYESSDNGATWTSVSTNGAKVYRGLIEHKGRRLILTTFGMEFSDDDGANWDTLTTSIKSSTSCGFIQGTGDTLYVYSAALNEEGVFYSVDKGNTWVNISGDLTSNDLKFMNQMVHFNGNLYLATLLAVKSNGQGTVTAVNEGALSNNALVTYPNPFSNILTIENNDGKNVDIELIDVTGQLILSRQSTSTRIVLNTERLTNGVYFLKVMDQDNPLTIRTKKVINW